MAKKMHTNFHSEMERKLLLQIRLLYGVSMLMGFLFFTALSYVPVEWMKNVLPAFWANLITFIFGGSALFVIFVIIMFLEVWLKKKSRYTKMLQKEAAWSKNFQDDMKEQLNNEDIPREILAKYFMRKKRLDSGKYALLSLLFTEAFEELIPQYERALEVARADSFQDSLDGYEEWKEYQKFTSTVENLDRLIEEASSCTPTPSP